MYWERHITPRGKAWRGFGTVREGRVDSCSCADLPADAPTSTNCQSRVFPSYEYNKVGCILLKENIMMNR